MVSRVSRRSPNPTYDQRQTQDRNQISGRTFRWKQDSSRCSRACRYTQIRYVLHTRLVVDEQSVLSRITLLERNYTRVPKRGIFTPQRAPRSTRRFGQQRAASFESSLNCGPKRRGVHIHVLGFEKSSPRPLGSRCSGFPPPPRPPLSVFLSFCRSLSPIVHDDPSSSRPHLVKGTLRTSVKHRTLLCPSQPVLRGRHSCVVTHGRQEKQASTAQKQQSHPPNRKKRKGFPYRALVIIRLGRENSIVRHASQKNENRITPSCAVRSEGKDSD